MGILTAPAPIAHTGAAPFEIDLNKQFGSISEDVCELLIGNLSTVGLSVQIRDKVYPLPAGVMNVFPARGVRSVKITPRLLTTTVQGIAATSDLYVVELAVATVGDQFPGTYPAVIAAGVNGIPLGTLIMPTNVSPNLLRVARPPGINFLRLNVFAGDVLILNVQGEQTGKFYLSISEPGAGSWFSGPTGCQITEAADTSLAITALVSASHNCSIRVTGYISEDAAPLIPRAQIAPVQVVTAVSNAGQAIVSGVPDTSAFPIGSTVLIAKANLTYTLPALVLAQTVNSITLSVNLGVALAVGDFVALLPTSGPLGVSDRIRSWDVQNFHQPGAGIRADLVLAGVVGMRYLITHARGRIVATVAAADGANWSINPGGSIVNQEVTGSQAATGANDQVEDDQAAWLGTVGGAPELAFRTAPQNANNFQSASVGGYLIAAEPV